MGLASWWLLMWLGQGAVSSTTVPLEPRVTFGIRNYRADGQAGGSATVSTDETGYIWVSDNFCSRGAGSVQSFSLSDPKAFAWRVMARTVDRTPDTWIVDVEWQRVWDRGQPTPLSQKSSRRLTLRVGDHVVLDILTPPQASQCSSEARLEATVEMLPAPRARGGGQAADGGRGGALIVGAGPKIATAELWLVHKGADGLEDGQKLTIDVGAAMSMYEFPPVPVDGAAGRVLVSVKGFLRPNHPAGGPINGLALMIDRRITPEDGSSVGTGGMAVKQIDMPRPTEVIGLEMPPAAPGERDQLGGQQFSLRLRMTPVK